MTFQLKFYISIRHKIFKDPVNFRGLVAQPLFRSTTETTKFRRWLEVFIGLIGGELSQHKINQGADCMSSRFCAKFMHAPQLQTLQG